MSQQPSLKARNDSLLSTTAARHLLMVPPRPSGAVDSGVPGSPPPKRTVNWPPTVPLAVFIVALPEG